MPEKIVINQSEVKERELLPKGVYSLSFLDNVAYLIKSRKDPSKIGLEGRLVPNGDANNAFFIWLPVNFGMSDGLDSRRFLQGLGIDPNKAQWGGDVYSADELRPTEDQSTPPVAPTNALLSIDEAQPIPVGFLRFKGEVGHEFNKQTNRRSLRLGRVVSREE